MPNFFYYSVQASRLSELADFTHTRSVMAGRFRSVLRRPVYRADAATGHRERWAQARYSYPVEV